MKKFFIAMFLFGGLVFFGATTVAYDMSCPSGQACEGADPLDQNGFCVDQGDYTCSCPGDEEPSCSGGDWQGCAYPANCWTGYDNCDCSAPPPTEEPAGCQSDPGLCDDGNPCTNDNCNGDGTCSNPQNGNCNDPTPTPPPECTEHIGDPACDDGIACTGDVCQSGTCGHLGNPCWCGDGICQGSEDAFNCPIDCDPKQCNDTIDNDGDGLIDWPADPGCINAEDDDEFNSPNNAACISHTIPATMVSGRPYTVSVTMRNSGTSTWTTATSYRLGSANPQNNNVWGVTRVDLPSSPITPGNNATFTFGITAPAAGTYSSQWQMLRELVEWFGELCGPTTVTVQPPTVPTVDIKCDPDWSDPGFSPSNGPCIALNAYGRRVQLSWTSTDATSCTASGDWSGSKPTSSAGTDSGQINGPNTFTLTCTGPGGTSAPDSVVVTLPGSAPSASNVRITEPDYCSSGAGGVVSWLYSDPDANPQTAYQVQVDHDASFNNPIVDSGKVTSSATSYVIPLGQLQGGTAYRTRVMVWDSTDRPSQWERQSLCTGPGCASNQQSWTTPVHNYPANVDFTYTPLIGRVGQPMQFDDAGTMCFSNPGNNPEPCDTWYWTWGDGSPPLTGVFPSPTHTYNQSGLYNVTFRIEDSSGFLCPGSGPLSKQITVKINTPRWLEVLPR